jgi:hypothetical protein
MATCVVEQYGPFEHLISSPRIDDCMRHDDPTINSILAADSDLNELESAVFFSLLEFFDAYDNKSFSGVTQRRNPKREEQKVGLHSGGRADNFDT